MSALLALYQAHTGSSQRNTTKNIGRDPFLYFFHKDCSALVRSVNFSRLGIQKTLFVGEIWSLLLSVLSEKKILKLNSAATERSLGKEATECILLEV